MEHHKNYIANILILEMLENKTLTIPKNTKITSIDITKISGLAKNKLFNAKIKLSSFSHKTHDSEINIVVKVSFKTSKKL
jgi:hypothetical protein